jgi:hypothetical protein
MNRSNTPSYKPPALCKVFWLDAYLTLKSLLRADSLFDWKVPEDCEHLATPQNALNLTPLYLHFRTFIL